MVQYTDIPLTITVTGARFQDADEIHVTLKQKCSIVIDISSVVVIDNTHLSCSVTQSQSALLSDRDAVEVQVNWLEGEMRFASTIAKAEVGTNLLHRILRHE